MRYQLCSIWTLYIVLFSWCWLGGLALRGSVDAAQLGGERAGNRQRLPGAVPDAAARPSTLVSGVAYLPHRLHALVYAALYTLVARVDAVAMLAVVCAVGCVKCVPWVLLLSRHRIRCPKNSKVCRVCWKKSDALSAGDDVSLGGLVMPHHLHMEGLLAFTSSQSAEREVVAHHPVL